MLLSPICLVLPMGRLILIKVLAHITGLYDIFMHAVLKGSIFSYIPCVLNTILYRFRAQEPILAYTYLAAKNKAIP